MTPRENCYISGCDDPNEILQYFPTRARAILSVGNVSDLDDETGTRGSSYKFAMLNSPKIIHLGKTLISPNW